MFVEKKGFTLVELLVVIAIIAVLLAMLMPALSKVRTIAEEATCRSNLKQYALGGAMYNNDNNSKFPEAWSSIFSIYEQVGNTLTSTALLDRYCVWHNKSLNPANESQRLRRGPLWDYLGGSSKVHVCKTFNRFAMAVGTNHLGSAATHPNIPIEPQFCYSMNAYLGPQGVLPTRVSDIKNPSGVFFFSEENCWAFETDAQHPYVRYLNAYNDTALCGGPIVPNATNRPLWIAIPRSQGINVQPYVDAMASFHKTTVSALFDGMANAVFVDGHVEMVEPDKTWYYAKPMEK
jgi:prepilin-type N-terminal cleavage/methylation domain-containing protein/prepilin-type processing-associated H-X9-DG protein